MAIDTALINSRVNRYQELRQKQRALHDNLVERIPKDVLEDCAKRLGIVRETGKDGRPVFTFESEHELSVLMDYCIYHGRQNGQTVIDRVLDESPPAEGTDELALLDAMQQAVYSMFMIEEVVPGVGAIISDSVGAEDLLLVDLGLSQSAVPGTLLAGNLVVLDGILMTTGAALPVGLDALGAIQAAVDEDPAMAPDSDAQDSRAEQQAKLATVVIRACLANGASTQVTEFDEPARPRLARPSAKGHARNLPCPCGSGKKYKRCHG